MKKKYVGLVGCYFHSIEAGEIKWQGLVVSKITEDYYLVQLFEWMLGQPNCLKLTHLSQMSDWHFYHSSSAMREAWQGNQPSK